MLLVRTSWRKERSEEYRRALAEGVHQAMVEAIGTKWGSGELQDGKVTCCRRGRLPSAGVAVNPAYRDALSARWFAFPATPRIAR